MTIVIHYLCLLTIISILILSTSTALALSLNNNRHLCFFYEYSSIRGPHFSALFDQTIEQTGTEKKRVAFITTTNNNVNSDDGSNNNAQHEKEEEIKGKIHMCKTDLDIEEYDVFYLNECEPIKFQERIQTFNPTVFWILDDEMNNVYSFRYQMKISGFDTIVENYWNQVLFVGEGMNAIICCCSNMKLGQQTIKKDNPKGAREPQLYGLNLLGPNQSIYFTNRQGASLDDDDDEKDSGNDEFRDLIPVDKKHVYIFSQQGEGADTSETGATATAMSFMMVPNERGAILDFTYPKPLPPMYDVPRGGRKCVGEPSIDPSRAIHMPETASVLLSENDNENDYFFEDNWW